MSFMDLVRRRVSVRKFLPAPVEREKLELCLEAARLAPSACNSQPWTFIVVDDPAMKDELCEKIFTGLYKMNSFARTAPVLVVVVSEKSRFFARAGGFLRSTSYYLIDIGIAAEHFVLQAAELGLGTCWIGWFDEKELKKILSIPKDKKVDVVIPVGYPDQPERPRDRKSPEKVRVFNPHLL